MNDVRNIVGIIAGAVTVLIAVTTLAFKIGRWVERVELGRPAVVAPSTPPLKRFLEP